MNCVDQCPSQTFANMEFCVSSCPGGEYEENVYAFENMCVDLCPNGTSVNLTTMQCDSKCTYFVDPVGVEYCISQCNASYPYNLSDGFKRHFCSEAPTPTVL